VVVNAEIAEVVIVTNVTLVTASGMMIVLPVLLLESILTAKNAKVVAAIVCPAQMARHAQRVMMGL